MVKCCRFVLAESLKIDLPVLGIFALLHCPSIFLKLLLDKLLHEHARVMQSIGSVYLSLLEHGVLLLGHIIRHELVVLWIVLYVEIVLSIARIIRINGLSLWRVILDFLLCRPGVLFLFQSHHFLDHGEI